MNTALVNSEAVDLLSRITGQRFRQKTLTLSVIFPAVLVGEEKVQIAQKHQELEQLQNNIAAIMNQCARSRPALIFYVAHTTTFNYL